jgi:hypothetical protein
MSGRLIGFTFPHPAALTDAASISIDGSLSTRFYGDLSQNSTLQNITNAVRGEAYSAIFTASGADRILSFDTGIKYSIGIQKLPFTIPNGQSRAFSFCFDGTNLIETDSGVIDAHGMFTHNLDQTFAANTNTPIAFNVNDEIVNITHSTTVNNSEFTIVIPGTYTFTVEPQYMRTRGRGTDVLNVFIQKDTGSGFGNLADSNIKMSTTSAKAEGVSPLTATLTLAIGDKIQFIANVETAKLKLDSFPISGTPPNEIPFTPSVIMNMALITARV